LVPGEKNALLSDPAAMRRLHRAVWTRPPDSLAPDWREALERCAARELAGVQDEAALARPRRVAASLLRFAAEPGGMAPV
jgi:hypothetical protein